jgi:hypothetical protein
MVTVALLSARSRDLGVRERSKYETWAIANGRTTVDTSLAILRLSRRAMIV